MWLSSTIHSAKQLTVLVLEGIQNPHSYINHGPSYEITMLVNCLSSIFPVFSSIIDNFPIKQSTVWQLRIDYKQVTQKIYLFWACLFLQEVYIIQLFRPNVVLLFIRCPFYHLYQPIKLEYSVKVNTGTFCFWGYQNQNCLTLLT